MRNSDRYLLLLALLPLLAACDLKGDVLLWSIDYDVNGRHQSYCEYSTPESRRRDLGDIIKVTNGHLIQKMYDYINNYITK